MSEYKKPVKNMRPAELMEELIEDAVAFRVTPLDRFVHAIKRISTLEKRKPETIFQQIEKEFKERTGLPFMPGTLPAGMYDNATRLN